MGNQRTKVKRNDAPHTTAAEKVELRCGAIAGSAGAADVHAIQVAIKLVGDVKISRCNCTEDAFCRRPSTLLRFVSQRTWLALEAARICWASARSTERVCQGLPACLKA